MAPSNKPRLYIVCFFRPVSPGGNPDPYHWGLASGPKGGAMNGMQLYHVRNPTTPQGTRWELEDPPRDLTSGPTPAMLTFTLVAKIIDLHRLQTVIASVPIDAAATWNTFNCQIWVQNALAAIAADGGCVGTNVLAQGWPALHKLCVTFSAPQRQARIQGQLLPVPRPMQNLLSD